MSPQPNDNENRPGYGTGRAAVIDAAITVVATQGIRKLTYRAVAAAAGVTHGTVQHHFGNLDQLLEASLEHCVEISIAGSALVTASDDIDDFLTELVESVRSTRDAQVFQYELVLESRRRPELRSHVAHYYSRYADAVGTSLRRMRLPDDDATVAVVFSAIDGLVFRALTDGDDTFDTLDSHLARLRAILITLRDAQQNR